MVALAARSVASIWRSSAFISGTLRRRSAWMALRQARLPSSRCAAGLEVMRALLGQHVAHHRAHNSARSALAEQRRHAAHGHAARREARRARTRAAAEVRAHARAPRRLVRPQFHDDRLEQRLGRQLPRHLALQFFVQHALVRCMGIDQHQALLVLRQHVDAVQLRDRRAEPARRARRRPVPRPRRRLGDRRRAERRQDPSPRAASWKSKAGQGPPLTGDDAVEMRRSRRRRRRSRHAPDGARPRPSSPSVRVPRRATRNRGSGARRGNAPRASADVRSRRPVRDRGRDAAGTAGWRP